MTSVYYSFRIYKNNDIIYISKFFDDLMTCINSCKIVNDVFKNINIDLYTTHVYMHINDLITNKSKLIQLD